MRIFLLTFLVVPQISLGAELRGYIAGEITVFRQEEQYPEQHGLINSSFILEPEFVHESKNDKNLITVKPFLRLDVEDSQKSHVDMRELSWDYFADNWEFKIGLAKVYWGVTESRHLVDVINQTDTLEGLDGEEKLGQPLIQLATLQSWGTTRIFAMPYFREREYGGTKSRLRAPLIIDTDQAKFESPLNERAPDFAIRYNHYIGSWDIGLANFYGTSREPLLKTGKNTAGKNVLIPFYQRMNQTSIDVQLTVEDWLWKIESITVSGQGERYNAISGGMEYTLSQINDSAIDLGLIVEYHRDDRGTEAPITQFDNDSFFAFRLGFNDIYDSQILAGMLVDNNNSDHSFSIEASKRLTDKLKIELEASIFAGSLAGTSSFAQKDDFALLRLSYYF